MDKTELVRVAYNLNDPDRSSVLSDDFRWTDELGSPPIDKATWTTMAAPLQAAIPDLSLIIDGIREEGEQVLVTSHFAGTFNNDLDLTAMGAGVIPATGKAFATRPQRDRVSFEGDKITELHNLEKGPDSGMASFLKALGADTG